MVCDVGVGAAGGASTLTLAVELAVWLRSSVTVPVTATGPGCTSDVSSRALLSRGVTRPAEVLYENVSGWLSGLVASQVTVELSPRFTVAGLATQLMLGIVETGGGGGGGGGGSNSSTP